MMNQQARSYHPLIAAMEGDGLDGNSVNTNLIPSILCGRQFPWPAEDGFETRFLEACRKEGLAGLVFRALKASGKWEDTPAPIRTGLLASRIAGEWIHGRVDTELARVLKELSNLGIQVLLFKGCALAHMLYPEPWLRLGCDSDILIRIGDRQRADSALIGLGYERHKAVSGELLVKQAGYSRKKDGCLIVLDVHWDLSQAQVLSALLAFDDLHAKSHGIPGISPEARTFSKVDSLILACAHWIGHIDDRKLVWLFDIHLLVESLTEKEQIDFCRTADQKGVCAICLYTLRQARKVFDTKIAARMEAALEEVKVLELEPSARLIQEKTQADRLWGDLLAVPGCRKKIQLAFEHLFPSADYMRYRYGQSNQLLLPFLYVHRAFKGLTKLAR